MEIIRQTNGLSTAEGIKMSVSDNIPPLKSVKDQQITVLALMEIETKSKDGEIINLLSLLLDDNTAICTNSETFKKMFFKLTDYLHINVLERFCITLLVKSGFSKSQREFLTCDYISHENVGVVNE